jgi:hypothetical protein
MADFQMKDGLGGRRGELVSRLASENGRFGGFLSYRSGLRAIKYGWAHGAEIRKLVADALKRRDE